MKITQWLGLVVLLLAQAAQAQTHYEQLEVGTVVQGGIGLGLFSKPFPLPAGQWTVAGRTVKEIPLVNMRTREPSGSTSKYELTLKNTQPGSMLPLMVFTVTGRLSNLDSGVLPCNASTSKSQWVDSFPERSPADAGPSGTSVCATSVGISNFKKFVADAAAHSNAWVKSTLSPVSADAGSLPDNAVLVRVSARRYRGHNIEAVFFVKQEGNLSDAAYANHLKPWVHAAGLSLLATVENNASTISLPTPFAGATDVVQAQPIDNRVQPTFTDVTPVGDVQIRKKFDFVEVNPDNFRAVLVNCIPQLEKNVARIDPPLPNLQHAIYKASDSSRVFVVKKTVGLCLQASSANFPIFAGEAFRGTVQPMGVSDEVLEDWNAQIAGFVARQGSAQVVYLYPNQNALTVRYWVDASAPLVIRYTTQFKPKGEWDKQAFDALFTDAAMTTVASTNLNAQGQGKKDLPF